MMANTFDQFDAGTLAAASDAPTNAFDQFDAPKPSGINQPWWAPVAQGALMGQGDRLRAATAATKESLSGGLPFSQAYPQALSQYQAATEQQKKDAPVTSMVGTAAGSVLPAIAGGELINYGLRGLGPAGRFLAGEADIPFVGRNAAGQFSSLTWADKAANYGTQALSRMAMMGREGAQAGALGAAGSGESIWEGARRGAEIGAIGGLAVQPATWALSQVARAPGAVVGMLPGWAKGAAGALGGEKLLEHLPQLGELATTHPIGAAVLGAGAGATALSTYLASHPEMRDLLTRLGIAGYASATGAQPAEKGRQ